ncbi:hypothetical protein KCP73_14140 [Salmonella enterica subsp. enterica]|nr:hypothetical protein KCP73_14140 [Salmonella enterica subsp. enterica]
MSIIVRSARRRRRGFANETSTQIPKSATTAARALGNSNAKSPHDDIIDGTPPFDPRSILASRVSSRISAGRMRNPALVWHTRPGVIQNGASYLFVCWRITISPIPLSPAG